MNSENEFVNNLLVKYGLKAPESIPDDWIQYCSQNSFDEPAFMMVAGQIECRRLREKTGTVFSTVKYIDLSDDIKQIIKTHTDKIDAKIDHTRDSNFDYFGIRTLMRGYLAKGKNGEIVESPQALWMRVSVGVWGNDLDSAFEMYDAMSLGYYTHATPTLFNSGTSHANLASCFLLSMKDDSLSGIYETLADCAQISKGAGGIGMHVHNIRAQGSHIAGTNGVSNGLVPMLKVYNATARYVDQGGGKRKGSFAIYISPCHMDIIDFLDLRKNHGSDEIRCRDLFLALWISNLFMKRVKANEPWTLFCPSQTNDLNELYGIEFEQRYEEYEKNPDIRKKTIPAQQIWNAILCSQVETGTPYILFKDNVNGHNMQKNIGVIKSSNLCCEIVQYSSPTETAVCNLASLCLPRFLDEENKRFDGEALMKYTRQLVRNLNRVIAVSKYPTIESERSNMKHRPMSIGIQGHSDLLQKMGLVYGSDDALRFTRDIVETIYFAAVDESCNLAEKLGPYTSFQGSPASKGLLHFDLYNEKPNLYANEFELLKARIQQHGLRNSLLVSENNLTNDIFKIRFNNSVF